MFSDKEGYALILWSLNADCLLTSFHKFRKCTWRQKYYQITARVRRLLCWTRAPFHCFRDEWTRHWLTDLVIAAHFLQKWTLKKTTNTEGEHWRLIGTAELTAFTVQKEWHGWWASMVAQTNRQRSCCCSPSIQWSLIDERKHLDTSERNESACHRHHHHHSITRSFHYFFTVKQASILLCSPQ